MRVIPLTNSYYFAIVDDEDYEVARQRNWYAVRRHVSIYAKTNDGSDIYLHRHILQLEDNDIVDHKNRCGLDCRRQNMRPATYQQNLINALKPQGENGSGYRGVTAARQLWCARIRVNNNTIYLGTYEDPADAARAYDIAAKEHHGDFAVLNFPDAD
jgi:hypothetical protein